ncbi:glycosyltransferase family 39 protein [Kitasatospora camelliae]|uniref:Glycosyltransferase family 39 protein n=1 Tax=Kitasatospora camelliae TaxID=3156397 RepID=A0AAU8K138_9ACTN
MGELRGSLRSAGDRAVWLGPALLTLVVGLYRIGTPELWRDEVSTWSASTRGVGELFAMLGHVDASHGAYYLPLHFWTAVFGDSPTALRLPSALAMAGACAFAALTARRMFGSRVAGLSAGLLFATVPNVSRYAQEARSYAIVTCAVAAGLCLLLRALERPSVGRWAGYGAVTAVAAALHLVSLIGLVGQLPFVLLSRGPRRGRWQFPFAALAAVALVLPLVAVGRSQSTRQLAWLHRPTAYELRFFWQELFGSYQVLYVFLALAGVALLWPGRRVAAVRLLVLAGLPVVVVWLLSQGGTSYFVDRYLLFTLPGWAALAGGGVAALAAGVRRLLGGSVTSRKRADLPAADLPTAAERTVAAGAGPAAGGTADGVAGGPGGEAGGGAVGEGGGRGREGDGPGAGAGVGVAATALVTAGVLAVPVVLGFPAEEAVRSVAAHTTTDFRGAARTVAAGYRAGDALVALGGDYAWAMTGPALSYYLPDSIRPAQPFVERSAVQAGDLYPVESRAPASTIGDEPRVWVVTIGTGEDPYRNLPAAQAEALRSVFTPTEVRHVRGLTVTLLVRSRR